MQIIGKQVAYYDKEGTVTEPELSGYYKADADKPVKSAQQASTFTIIKDATTGKWHLEDDGVHVVNGQLINLPTMTFDNHIPIYYTYKVEELPVSGYVPSYEYGKTEEGGTSATVTNKPDTNVPVTRVKAKKQWVDIEGNDITKKMGLEDGVSVDVSVRCSQSEALGTVTKTIDTDNNEIIFEFTAPTDNGNREIRMQVQEVTSYTLSSENLTANGRTQILTQADLEGLNNTTKVETLELNMTNGWSNTSKEYVKKGTATVDHGGWSSQEQVTFTYFVVEPDGANYEAEYHIEGDTITTVNVDKKLEVDKKWLASNGDEITGDKDSGTITYTIKRNAYPVTPPAQATIDYSNLKAGGHNIQAGTIAQNIKVGATIKITVLIKDRTPTAEDSPLDGIVISGGNVLSSTSAYRVNTYNPSQYDWMRDYFVEVTDPVVTLSGDLVTTPDLGNQARLNVSIQKEPAAIITPQEGSQPIGDPVEVGTVTVSHDAIVSYAFSDDYTDATVTEGSDSWSAVINKLPAVDDQGNILTYTVEEAVADDFEQVLIDEDGQVTVFTGELSAPLGGKVKTLTV